MMDSTTIAVEARRGDDAFACARACFEGMLSWLEGPEAASLSHAELEQLVLKLLSESARRSA